MALRRGGSHASPAQLPLQKTEEYTVKQLKARLSFAGVENAGINDKVRLAELAVKHELI